MILIKMLQGLNPDEDGFCYRVQSLDGAIREALGCGINMRQGELAVVESAGTLVVS